MAVLQPRLLGDLRLAEEVVALHDERRLVAELALDVEDDRDAVRPVLRVHADLLELAGVVQRRDVARDGDGIVRRALLRLAPREHRARVAAEAVDFGNKTGSDYTVVGKIILAQAKENVNGILGLFTGVSEEGNSGGNGLGILGQIANLDASKGKVEIQVKFVDNKSGEIVFAKTFSGEKAGKDSKTALISACHEAAEKFLKELQATNPFVARIADIDGERVYIDQGSTSGLQLGEVLMISRELEPITVNGKIVGMKTISICTARVIEVNAEYSVCRVDGNSYLIQKGDIVKRT